MDYSLPDKTDIELIFRSTTRSGLLLSIAAGRESLVLEQLYGQVSKRGRQWVQLTLYQIRLLTCGVAVVVSQEMFISDVIVVLSWQE